MSDYAKLKNAELEAILKQRGLATGGKKADMVARLQEDDNKQPTGSKDTADEDAIDWDDEEPENPAEPASEPAATTTAPAAPPSSTAPPEAPKPTEDETAEPVTEAAAQPERAKTPVDFSIGLKETTIDEEIERRKARAKKFGVETTDPLAEEALQKLERAKKFGEAGGPRGLNEALPERQKRRHEGGGGDGGRDHKRRDHDRRGVRGGGRNDDNNNRNRNRGPPGANPSRVEKPRGQQPKWSDADRAAADARKARFAAQAK